MGATSDYASLGKTAVDGADPVKPGTHLYKLLVLQVPPPAARSPDWHWTAPWRNASGTF